MKYRGLLSEALVFGLACAISATLPMLTSAAVADTYDVGSIHIDQPWARATPKGARVGGGYMKITNRGTMSDRLIGGSTPVASRFVIHEMTMDHDVMKMRALDEGLEIKPGATVQLDTESLHIMLEGLQQPLQQGQRVKGTLVFEKAGSIEIEYVVEGIGAKSAAPDDAGVMHRH
jgi:copper(I)-binding protein